MLAEVVELVDTQDLKSCALNRRAGSIPAFSTLKTRKSRSNFDRLFCWVQHRHNICRFGLLLRIDRTLNGCCCFLRIKRKSWEE